MPLPRRRCFHSQASFPVCVDKHYIHLLRTKS
jgi:hypothetical protein